MKKIIYILLLVLLFGGEDSMANTAVSQEDKIDSFIASKYADAAVVPNNGVNRIVLEAGDSTCFAAKGDIVDFEYIGYTFTTSIGSAFTQGSYKGVLEKGKLIKGLEYGIEGMCPGERSYIVFSCKYGYDKTVAGIGSDQALAFEIFMNDINAE